MTIGCVIYYRLLLKWEESCHPVHHVPLLRLHVQLQVGAESGLEVGTNSRLEMVSQLGLVDVDHQGIGVEGIVELVHQYGQPPDLLGQTLGHLILHVLHQGTDLVLHLGSHHLQLPFGEVKPVK